MAPADDPCSPQCDARCPDRGQEISAGDYVFALFVAANRDEDYWNRPDTFDITRANGPAPLSVSHGPHTCIGAALARLEVRCILEEYFARFAGVSLAGDGHRMPSILTWSWSDMAVDAHPKGCSPWRSTQDGHRDTAAAATSCEGWGSRRPRRGGSGSKRATQPSRRCGESDLLPAAQERGTGPWRVDSRPCMSRSDAGPLRQADAPDVAQPLGYSLSLEARLQDSASVAPIPHAQDEEARMDFTHFDPLGTERSENLWDRLKELCNGPVVRTDASTRS